VLDKWRAWCDCKGDFSDRTQKAFAVTADAIRGQGYDLSINRYKEQRYVAEEYEDPKVVLTRLKALEEEIVHDLADLEALLK
jgi:type I restriction enzyme M protein